MIRPLHGAAQTVALAVLVVLFLAAGLSAVPVMVLLVLGAQTRVGNGDAPLIVPMVARPRFIVWGMWALILAGTVVALPAMVEGGFFGERPRLWIRRTLEGTGPGHSLGRLVARPGMSVAEMARQSTVRLDTRHPELAIVGGGPFDFALAGTGLTFPGARYWFISTVPGDPSRVRSVDVGVSPGKLSRAELDAANAALRARLIADGWLAGHEVYRDLDDRALHGGASRGPEGRTWLKDAMVLDVEVRRMDDPAAGEDPATAGEWIQFIDLWPRRDYPGIDRLVFEPAAR